jgi:hypothetical protein
VVSWSSARWREQRVGVLGFRLADAHGVAARSVTCNESRHALIVAADCSERQQSGLGQCAGMSPEIDTATALRPSKSASSLVVLRGALDRRYPTLAPLHPDLVFGLQLEGRLIQTSDPDLDVRVLGVGCVKEPRPTAGAEAATVIA